jgi:hypothetical protein
VKFEFFILPGGPGSPLSPFWPVGPKADYKKKLNEKKYFLKD